MEISEHWTARPCRLDSDELFGRLGQQPFALLHGGEASGSRVICARDPLLVLDQLDPPQLSIERTGVRPPLAVDWIVAISYEHAYRNEPLLPDPPCVRGMPEVYLALYREVEIYCPVSQQLYTAVRHLVGSEREPPRRHSLGTGTFSAQKAWDSDSRQAYIEKVAAVREQIAAGNVYQVNLTRQESWSYRGDLTQFARRLLDANPAPFSALIADADFAVVCSSPERFIRRYDNTLLSQPIKGTRPRSAEPLTDQQLADELLASRKDRAELAMITDLIRNDLSRVCQPGTVQVQAFPRLESYANVHHLVADVVGDVQPGTDLVALLRPLLPGGSITGCPKLAAMQQISALETHPRSIYTGTIGWAAADGSALDVNVAIRTCHASANELVFGVGGGIVWDSDPAAEYEETVHKGSSIVACLRS